MASGGYQRSVTRHAAAALRPVLDRMEARREEGEAVIALRRRDGSVLRLPVWRSRCDVGALPAIGTVRLHAAPSPEVEARLALATAIQCAAFHLPYGGAAGGVAAPDAILSRADLERLPAAFGGAFPDMVLTAGLGGLRGTLLTGWLGVEARSHARLAPTWGRPRGFLREDAVAMTAAAAIAALHPRPGNLAVLGCDQPALRLARALIRRGWRMTAAAAGGVAVGNRVGLSPAELACALRDAAGVAGLVGERGTRRLESALDHAADLVVVGGGCRFGTGEALALRGAPTVMELAPEAVSAEAEALLSARGSRVVPEVVAGAGAPILAHLLWLQRRRRLDWSPVEIKTRLLRRFKDALAAMLAEDGEDLRMAALRRSSLFMESVWRGRGVCAL